MGLKHLILFEDLPVGDSFYDNPLFKIRYKQLDDLSNKRALDTIDKPINDLLDSFGEGDIISGRGIDDNEIHKGEIVLIKKDGEGENIEIVIEEDGKTIKLKPSTVIFEPDGDNGNTKTMKEPMVTGDVIKNDFFGPSTYENKIKKYDDF